MCEALEEKGCRIHSKLLYERNVIIIGTRCRHKTSEPDTRSFPSAAAATLGPTLARHGDLTADGRTGRKHGPGFLAALLRGAALRLGGVLDAPPEVKVLSLIHI